MGGTKEYNSYKNKYGLPSLDELEKAFGKISVGDDSFFLVEVRNKIVDKIDHFSSLLSEVIDPDTNIKGMYETKALSDDNRRELYETYKKLMKSSRESEILNLSYEEELEAEFIKSFFEEWQEISLVLKKHLEILMLAWSKDLKSDEDLRMFIG
ncbi:hypothetical protein GOV05_04660 [Candidatus Woesearchaeota archaeon]|nr:hypothetical protein [Candidatus Woesearchaeota archaeon]